MAVSSSNDFHQTRTIGKLFPVSTLASFAVFCLSVVSSHATAQSVNWLDPLSYPKPRAIAVSQPDEATVTNKYWIDLSNGSGSSCTQSSPCRSFGDVSGKPGTTGGPAYIYLKGTGAIGSPTLYGAAGKEVVIKPWNDSTMATITGRNNWTTRHQYVIWDGGPNLNIKFLNSGSGQFDPSVYFNAKAGLHSNITFYRTQWQVTNAGEWFSQWGIYNNLSFVNSEFYATGTSDPQNQHHIYMSGASNYGPSSNLKILGSIFRDTPGEAIEIRLFQNLDGLVIDGNAMHNIGKGTCSASWKCRSPITLTWGGGSPSLSNAQISNNLIWDTGEGIVRLWLGSPKIYNNTVFNWGMGTPANGGWGQWAFFGPGPNDGSATISNNIIYATGSTANGHSKIPFDGSNFTATGNICASGKSCGTASQTLSSGTLLSTDQNSTSFLKPDADSVAVSGGVKVGLSTDYLGKARLESTGVVGIGAMLVSGAGASVPEPPKQVLVQ